MPWLAFEAVEFVGVTIVVKLGVDTAPVVVLAAASEVDIDVGEDVLARVVVVMVLMMLAELVVLRPIDFEIVEVVVEAVV